MTDTAIAETADAPRLARRLGVFDATMIVMGGIVGSGIFVNPHVVAERVHTPLLIVGAWVAGRLIFLTTWAALPPTRKWSSAGHVVEVGEGQNSQTR